MAPLISVVALLTIVASDLVSIVLSDAKAVK